MAALETVGVNDVCAVVFYGVRNLRLTRNAFTHDISG